MKIVIISRCIYPALAPRPHRATELAKYFAATGHDVFLYGVLGDYDYSAFERETGIHIRSLGKMRCATLNSDGYIRNNFFDKVAVHLLKKAIEYPDIELAGKITRVLKQMPDVDLLITIAAPYPIHWGAAQAKRKLGKAFPKLWISDCGDPYMGDSTRSHPFYFRRIEEFWGKQTDLITIPIDEGRTAYSPSVQKKIRIIPQGFDFSGVRIDKAFLGNSEPHFAYSGVIYPGYRDPTNLIKYLGTLKDIDFKFVIYTKQFQFYRQFEDLLGDKIQLKGYVPREQLIYELSQMDFLINLKNQTKAQAPSKLIDYYLSGRPIIDISTDFIEKSVLMDFLQGKYDSQHIKQDISQYDIRNVGRQFLDLYYESADCR